MKTLRFQGKKLGMSLQVPLEEREDLPAHLVQEGTEVAMAHQPKEVTTVSHIAMELYTADVAATTLHHPDEEDPGLGKQII